MQQEVKFLRLHGKTIGFVPTMGYLHEGHTALLEKARVDNDIVVLSIFVNPLQFGANEGFDTYPRDIKRDEQIAKNAGASIIFYPETIEMYNRKMSVNVKVQDRVDVLCGRTREGHFDGVATVLTKLFHIVLPDRAYFGMKDAQQVAVVDGLIKDFNFPIELIPVETVREEDGLAKSSRNVHLSQQEWEEASELYKSIQKAKTTIRMGERNPEIVQKMIHDHLLNKTSGTIDYVEIYSYPELQTITKISGKVLIALAVKFTKTRLIDNITLDV